jgi:hypothetical protein
VYGGAITELQLGPPLLAPQVDDMYVRRKNFHVSFFANFAVYGGIVGE